MTLSLISRAPNQAMPEAISTPRPKSGQTLDVFALSLWVDPAASYFLGSISGVLPVSLLNTTVRR